MLDRVQRALQRPARSRHAYLAAAGLGLAVYLIVFGIGHPLGTSSYWDLPLTDHRAYMMGYRYFLHEPWHWPVFVVHTMNVPFDKSIAFTDSIPAWAFVNKALATIVPPWGWFTERAYLGLWYALLYALQPLVAVAVLRQLGQRTWAATLGTALIFLAAPAWTNRYVHGSMSAHFLTLWALYLYLRSPDGVAAPRRLRVHQLVQLGVATLVNPYHAVMSYGLFVAAVLRARKAKELAIWAIGGFAVIAAGAWFASYFSKEAGLAMFGFDVASTNVLSFVMPYRSTLFGNHLFADPTGFQYEGVAYAGLGVLALLALYLPRARGVGAVISRHRFLFVVALGAWVFALSNHVWIGGHELVAYPLPSKLGWLADQFRSPGRFVWVPMYVAMVFLVKEGLARFASGWRVLVVPALAVLQLVDVAGSWSEFRANTRGPDHPRIELAPWRALIHAHDAVFVHPSYDCVLDGTVDMDYVSLDIEYLASELALPINGVYSARPTRNCEFDETMVASSLPRPGALYVFLRRDQATAYRFATAGATCGEFKFGRACSLDAGAIAAAIHAGILTPMAPPPPATPLAYGTMLAITPQASPAYFDAGWSWPDEHARFTDGPIARLVFQLPGEPPPGVALKLRASGVVCGGRRSQHVDVTINGVQIGALDFTDPDMHAFSLPITRPELLRGPVTYLALRVRDARRLYLLGCNGDRRALGIMVQEVGFE